ncbi:MAG: universal stress protein [Myxococcales bacterium]|nr:universal stress protein [Myxococcales bacterium]
MPAPPLDAPLVESVLHPTDFSAGSESAFAHALAVALLRRTRLSLLHVAPHPHERGWSEFPAVRKTLERWGLLAKDSPRSAVFRELGISVEKIAIQGRNPAQVIQEHLEEEPVELIVLATEGRDGLPRWLRGSVAESVARESEAMTLFVPKGARGFVDVENGHLTLRRILVPIAPDPAAEAALTFATRAARLAGEGDVEIVLLHVGGAMPALDLSPDPAYSFRPVLRSGKVVDAIDAEARESNADLVVMVTQGPEHVIDALRGTTTEQVVRRAACPVLAVPVRWLRAEEVGRWAR